MHRDENEESLLHSVTLQNARAIMHARERAERELISAKEALERKSGELAEQREFFRVTLSSIGDGVITTDTEARITFLNPVAEAFTGWKSSEAVGQPLEKVFNIINEQTRKPAPNPVARVLREGIVVGLANQTTLVAQDGREMAIADSAAPIRDAAGGISGVVMVFQDVSVQRKADAALHESNQRVTNILESISDALMVLDRDWLFTYINPRAEQVLLPLDKTRANLLGKNYWEEFPDVVGTIVEKNFRHAVENRVRVEFEVFSPPLNAWFEMRAYPARDGLSIYFLDITGKKLAAEVRKETEERLRRSEEELRAMADSIPQLAWMAHPDGHIFWYNLGWYEYTGTTLQQMQGWGWESVHDPETLPRVKERWTNSIRTGTPFEMEFPLRGADGIFRWFLTRIRPVRDQEGRITRWFGTNTNVDEQRRLLQSLSEAHDQLERRVNERTGDLHVANENLRDLSARLLQLRDDERRRLARELHDSVGQIFAALSMNLSVMKSQAHLLDANGAKAVSENVKLIDQGNREIRTITHLLHPPLLEIAGLATALRWYVDGFSERSKIKVEMEIPEDFGRLPNDIELAIFRIVQECLTNIHRHSGSATAAIRILQEHSRLVVQVMDHGHGIPQEKLRELTGFGRTGVGFGGIRERLRQLGGTLEITSEGKGTMVSATIKVG